MRLRRSSTIAYVVVVVLVVPVGFSVAAVALRSDAPPKPAAPVAEPRHAEPPKPKPDVLPPKPKPDTVPPKLVVTSPKSGAVLAVKKVTFKGVTEPGSKVKAGPYAATVDSKGNWSLLLVLDEGVNRVLFTAKDRAGNASSASVKVVYDPPAPKPKPEPAVSFTAHQKFGTCNESPPYDVFYGTAPAGSLVKVYSPYGGGYTKVGSSGEYELRVEFPEAPVGKTFEVWVKLIVDGQKVAYKTFSFTHAA